MLAIDDEECIRKLSYAVLVRQGHEVWGRRAESKGLSCSSGCVRILPSWTCIFRIWAV